jgi:putative serine protease PepD
MKKLLTAISVVAAGVVGAVLTLLVAGGGSKTVTTDLVSQSGSVPASFASSGSNANTINGIYKRDINGVVDLTVKAVEKSSSNGFFSTPSDQVEEDEGAGVVYDKQGDIVTDEHVVAGATSVTVNFEDGYSAKAKVLGTDASSDVAVVKVDVPASELHPIGFANSTAVKVGDPVVAIGSPFGLPGTVTSGIVSAVGRPITAPNNYSISGAIQTDASINPGNSGGPLIDAAGEVIGLNDQIETNSDESDGIGFATPGNTDVQVANTIIAGKTVKHAWLGVSLVADYTGGAEIGKGSGSIVAGSPAQTAGLKGGDVITKIDGHAVTSSDGFIAMLGNYTPGQKVTLTVKRSGKSTRQINLTLGERPATAPTAG